MHAREILNKYQHKIDFNKSEEYKLVATYKNKISNIPLFKRFNYKDKDFELIVMATLANAIKNKEFIEERAKFYIDESKKDKKNVDINYVKENIKKDIQLNSLPYFIIDKKEYYVPIFPYAIDNIYSYEQDKLNNHPYSGFNKEYSKNVIDLFEQYNFSLFDSTFTHLIKIKKKDNVMAFYHHYFHALYFINEQGRLDYKVALFDKYLEDINIKHVVIRLLHAVDAYFNNNRDLMFLELYNNHLISHDIFIKIRKKKV